MIKRNTISSIIFVGIALLLFSCGASSNGEITNYQRNEQDSRAYTDERNLELFDTAQIKSMEAKEIIFRIDGDIIKDYKTNKKIYRIDGKIIKDFTTGKELFWIDDKFVRESETNKKLFWIFGNDLRDFTTKERVYRIDGDYIKAY